MLSFTQITIRTLTLTNKHTNCNKGTIISIASIGAHLKRKTVTTFPLFTPLTYSYYISRSVSKAHAYTVDGKCSFRKLLNWRLKYHWQTLRKLGNRLSHKICWKYQNKLLSVLWNTKYVPLYRFGILKYTTVK